MTFSQSRIFVPRSQDEVEFDLFGPMRKEDIRVGYIDPDKGYVTGITICEANTHAKKNPGAQFILKNRDKVRFMNINDVNNLTPNTAYDTSGVPPGDKCKGVTFDTPPGPPAVEFMGGGGVGAKANPVVGNDGSVLAVHIVEGGFGYQYPPLVNIQDPNAIGAGVVAESRLGEVNKGWETYGDESDIEDYFPIQTSDGYNLKSICKGGVSEVPYGYTYNISGEKLNEWDPSIYANLEENLFRRRILEYQEYLANLRSPWFATRYKGDVFPPSQISSDGGLVKNPEYIFEVRKAYPANNKRIYAVQHQAWGGYDVRNLDADINATAGNKSTDKELVNITFDVFVHVSHANRTGGGGLRFKFTEVLDRQAKPEQGRYGKHQFTIKCTDVTDVNTKDRGKWDEYWDSEGVQSVTKKIKADTLYEVQALGSSGGKSIHQGLLKSELGYGGEGISLEDEYDQQIGTKIFADLLSSKNDNDDIQIGARKGKFTAEGKWYTSDGTTQNFPTSHLTHNSDGTWTEDFRTAGVDTYDLYFTVTRKELEDTAGVTDDLFATEQEGSVTQSFMNKYAISPVPMSNEIGSDYANQLFTMEWDMLFPYPGEYTFIGQTDNECKFYLDGQLIGDLSTWNTAPWVLKKEMQWSTKKSGDNGKLHTIRLDLVNTPKVEGVIVQQKEGQTFVAEDSGDVFQDVTFDGYSNIPTLPTTTGGGKDVDVLFKSTSSAGCTNRFYLVDLNVSNSNEIEWLNIHSRNFPLSGRLNRSRTQITFLDDHGGDSNGWVNITSGNARFSDDASKIEKVGSGSDIVTISYGWKDHGRNHGDGFIINGVEWNNKAPQFSGSRGSMEKTVDITQNGGIREILTLERNDEKTVTLNSGKDYGAYMTTTCSTDMPGAEMVENGKKILYEDLGMSGDYNDLIVTCSVGRFRSKDGTDDTGIFGHPNYGKLKDQILWSTPTVEGGGGLNGGGDNMQFNFSAQDGTHSFSITAKDIQKSSQITKSVKVNTTYAVKATVLHDSRDRMEQGPAKTLGSATGKIDGDFHQAWESKQQIGSLHKIIHGSLIGADDATNIQVLASKGNFKLVRKYRHSFIPQNVSDFSWAQKKKGEGLQTYDITYEHVVNTAPFTPVGSTSSEIQTKNIFATDTHINDANRQLWRTNVYNRGGFLNAHGVCPFNTTEADDSMVNDNPYAGDHTIIWNNIDFPVSASYNVRVAVDDSVILDFEGPDGVTRIEKNGFINGQSTEDSLYTQWFDKGSYKLTAILTQKEGGRFGFKALTEAEKLARRQRIFDDLFVPEPPPPTTAEVTFKTTSSAGFTNSVAISGVCTLTRNASATKTIEIGKNYTVAFSSSGGNDRVRLKLSADKRTVYMEDLTDGDFNDLVLTITGGKFHGIKDHRFLTYEGGPSEGGAGSGQPTAPRFPTSVDDIILKGINPMALAIDIKVSYGTGQRVAAQSWYENPMGVAFNIRAPLAPPPVEDEPKSEGRCPNNPLWTTRFTTNSDQTWYPCYSKVSDYDKNPASKDDDWGEFMNKYAMSPVPPKSSKGTDEGGKWYENTWNVAIPYEGWYTFKMCSDFESEFYVDGVKLDELTNPGHIVESQKTIFIDKKMDEIAEFRVRVKNKSTTKMRTINKKIFSARDWVKEGGATDEGFVAGENDPHKFKDVKFDLFTHAKKAFGGFTDPEVIGDVVDITFTSTSAAGCTNRFYVVERGADAPTNEIEWLNLHSRNYPLSGRLNRERTGMTFVDEHKWDANGWVNITSGNAKFSDDASKLIKVGSGSNTVTIEYGYKDHGRNHGDGFVINGVEWNNKVPGVDSYRDTITKTVEISTGDGFNEICMLERNDSKKVSLKSGTDYGVYFTTTCNTDPMGCEITNNGTRILIEDLGVRTPTDDMVVTVSGGKFRSKDGTDDWGLFGHPNYGKLKDQILWSIPKTPAGDIIHQDWNTNDIRFTFTEKGGGHTFEIKGGEVGNVRKNENGRYEGNGVVTKSLKLNTKYVVQASVRGLTGRDDQDRMEQGFTPRLGSQEIPEPYKWHQEWENSLPVGSKWKTIFGDVIGSTGGGGGDLQVGATEGNFTTTQKRRNAYVPQNVADFSWKDKEKGQGLWTYGLEYEIPWQPPVKTAKDLTRSGTARDGITYAGPYLFSYLERDWGNVMNKYSVAVIESETQDLSAPNDNILGTKILSWSNVPFEHEGNYEAIFMADDNAKFFINDEEVLISEQGKFSDADAITRIFSIRTAGHYSIRIELENTPTHSPVFFDNPTGVVLEITKPLDIPTYDADGIINSKSWTQNPMGVSAECIPPPCSKLLDGKGVVDEVIITDPGNKYIQPPLPPETIGYNVVNEVVGFHTISEGINYPADTVAKIGIGTGDPIQTPVILGEFGKITGIVWPPPFEGEGTSTPPPTITEWPTLTFGPPDKTEDFGGGSGTPPDGPPGSSTGRVRIPEGTSAGEILFEPPSPPAGVNAQFVPIIKPTILLPDDIDPRTGIPIPSNQLIQVTDLVGLKQTGWYNGKEYYGAVFYKDGVRYAGYYETAGALIRVYSTKQESIDSQVTTPPSAILRQGTDVSSNDPRLNIPGTPQ